MTLRPRQNTNRVRGEVVLFQDLGLATLARGQQAAQCCKRGAVVPATRCKDGAVASVRKKNTASELKQQIYLQNAPRAKHFNSMSYTWFTRERSETASCCRVYLH